MSLVRRLGVPTLLLSLGFAGGALANPRDQLGKITGANKHLDAAQLSLSESPEDFGGHKTRARALIGQAQAELREAVEWANAH